MSTAPAGHGYDLESYAAALSAHNWALSFYANADKRAWRANQEELGRLRAAQREMDPDFEIWNGCVPESKVVHVVGSIVPPKASGTASAKSESSKRDDALMLIAGSYAVLAEQSLEWRGRHSAEGQTLLAGLRDYIAGATGVTSEEIQRRAGV